VREVIYVGWGENRGKKLGVFAEKAFLLGEERRKVFI